MFRNSLFIILFITSVRAQLNGEFWWLNSKLNNFKKVRVAPPNIDASDFLNDDSAKIIFRDDDLFNSKTLKPISDRTSKNIGDNKVVWPTEEHMKNHDVEVFTDKNIAKENIEEMKPSKIKNKHDDLLVVFYPKNEKYTTVLNKASTESIQSTSTQRSLIDKTTTETLFNYNNMNTATTTKDKESQNICTYTHKKKCYQLNGFVYEYSRTVPTSSGEPFVCCILPVQPILDTDNLSETIHFPRISNINRYKRSDTQENIALKQRDFLLKHKFSSQRQNFKPAATLGTKIVTPPEDDYVDPYWNVKNVKFQNPNDHKVENTQHDYYSEDYAQEYTDELPKPGLVGLYSDHAKAPSGWSFANGNKGFPYGGSDDDYDEDDEDDEDDDDNTFGYSTIDPRQGIKNQKHKERPQKLTTTSDDVTYDAESHTINFQSNPDFHVFQGFKLLNLYRNTSRGHTKKTSNPDQSKETFLSKPDDSEETEEIFDENQLFIGCGKTIKKVNDRGNQIGEAASGSHPWMALVVLTKRRNTILCYATLVHPRAAVTVADCVQGTAPGDITVLVGLWDLNDRSRARNRVATVHVHPRYKPGDAENNLAVLYWKRPLQLGVNVQPACLGEPQIGDECKFFGWGGLEQGIQQQRSRWQRATVRACTGPGINKRTRSSGESFCVSTARRTVTGMGGPLICEVEGRSSIVGVVVSRNSGYVLSPVREWTMKADNLINWD